MSATAQMVTRTYRTDIEEHVVTVAGREVATAHKVAAGRWSVKIGAKFHGLAPTEAIAIAHLDRIADAMRADVAVRASTPT